MENDFRYDRNVPGCKCIALNLKFHCLELYTRDGWTLPTKVTIEFSKFIRGVPFHKHNFTMMRPPCLNTTYDTTWAAFMMFLSEVSHWTEQPVFVSVFSNIPSHSECFAMVRMIRRIMLDLNNSRKFDKKINSLNQFSFNWSICPIHYGFEFSFIFIGYANLSYNKMSYKKLVST